MSYYSNRLPAFAVGRNIITDRVILTLINDDLEATIFELTGRCRLLVGRAPDCDIQLPADRVHGEVSRHHCLFEIEPPCVGVIDLGSLNGTYVNGKRVGSRLFDALA